MRNVWIYIAVMFGVSYILRTVPMLCMRRPIRNRFIKSFLYYVPYVTISVMTFPAIVQATQSPIAGVAALIAGIVAAWLGAGLLPVAGICCAVVFILEWFV